MTLSDYMSPARFPKTSQKGLSAGQQLMLDAHKLDMAREHLENGHTLTPEQQAVLQELQQKEPHFQKLIRESRQQGNRPAR